jgi:hypothetical protein
MSLKQPSVSEETIFHTVTQPVTVSVNRVKCLLCSAFEGGSNYWIDHVENQLADGMTSEDFRKGGKFTDPENYWPSHMIVPFFDGCGVKIVVSDEDDLGDDEKPAILNVASMQKGLELMAAMEPNRHWQDFIDENDDACTGDVFLQLCLFGKLIFG